MKILKFLGYGVLGLIALGAVGRACGDPDAPGSSATAPRQRRAAAAPQAPLPADEAAFVAAAMGSADEYRSAPNELKKTSVRRARAIAIKEALGGARGVNGWVGVLSKMKTTGDGAAYVEIKLDRGVVIKCWNNALSDGADKTLIPESSPLYGVIADLKEGSTVRLSGDFLAGQDFVKEASMTEQGSMTDPEFLFRFRDIRGL